jgi:glutaredoxin-like protein
MTDTTAPAVTLYWRPGCAFCSTLRHRLHRAGVALDEHNIWSDPAAAAFVRSVARGNETVPTVVVDGVALVNPSGREVLARLGLDRPAPSGLRALVRRLVGDHSTSDS